MKYRSGFVSNSSSSSFIVAYRTNFDADYKLVAIDPFTGSPFAFLIQEIGATFKQNIEHTYVSVQDYFESKEDPDWTNQTIVDLLNKGYVVSEGSISDESDDIDYYLARNKLDINTKDLVIWTEGGY